MAEETSGLIHLRAPLITLRYLAMFRRKLFAAVFLIICLIVIKAIIYYYELLQI